MRGLTLRGKVVVVNSLVLSKLTHTLSVYNMPSRFLTDINNCISAFLWGSKKNLIAHKTIISDHKNGGLKLVDIITKKQALRVKIIQKYLQTSNNHVWKDYFQKSVASIGHCGDYNLCQIHPKKQYCHLGPFDKKVFEAWRLVRPLLKVKAENKTQVLQLPFLHNPEITYLSNSLACSSLAQAEMHRVRDILGKQGQIDTEKILNVMRKRELDSKENKSLTCAKN